MWYQMLYIAANENFLAIPQVTEKQADEFLYFCNFIAEKNQIESLRLKALTNK